MLPTITQKITVFKLQCPFLYINNWVKVKAHHSVKNDYEYKGRFPFMAI